MMEIRPASSSPLSFRLEQDDLEKNRQCSVQGDQISSLRAIWSAELRNIPGKSRMHQMSAKYALVLVNCRHRTCHPAWR